MKLTRILFVALVVAAALVVSTGLVLAQEEEHHPIVTTASRSVGVGTYVAAQAYGVPGVPASDDAEEQPAVAIVMPYGIYPDMMVMDLAEFVQPDPIVEGWEFTWSVVDPDGEAVDLAADGQVVVFLAEAEGAYEVTLAAVDPDGMEAETVWVVHSTTYVGSGYLEGPEEADDQCADCHDDVLEAWQATGHADMLVRGLEGTLSDHYGPDCISCHTTGFNTMATAVNGGFDDLAAEAGWEFPEHDALTEGGWDAFVADFPEVAGLANIQCESCHGPGYAHVWEGGRRDSMISRGLEYGVCAQCHAEEPYHVFPQQWELSGHATENARAFTYPVGEDHAECVACHSGAGFIDAANGLAVDEQRTNYQVITCAVCHDPHDVSNPNQLRVFDSVVLPDGTEVSDAGPSATCMSCHNARRSADAIVDGAASGEGRFSTPHYSTGAELMNGVGGYTWGEVLPNSPHGWLLQDSCVSCHMAATPGTTDDGPLPGHNTAGEHTFAMVSSVDGTENIGACTSCHSGIESFSFAAFSDYDGDGAIETNEEEIAGLQELVSGALAEAGVVALDHYPYFEMPEDAGDAIFGATWNLKFTGSGGSAAHNLRYTVALLQLSYEKVAGTPVPDAYILAPQ